MAVGDVRFYPPEPTEKIKLAKRVEWVPLEEHPNNHKSGRKLVIDGEVFPYHTTLDGIRVEQKYDDFTVVWIPLAVDTFPGPNTGEVVIR